MKILAWDTELYKGSIPTKTEVMTKAQELFDKEAMRKLRIERQFTCKQPIGL